MTLAFAELLPVGWLINAVSEQLINTAAAARDILNERSFTVLANYLLSIRSLLHKLDAREMDGNSCVISALNRLKEEVANAEILVKKYKERSRISNLLHCRRICEEIQKSIRDIGNTLKFFGLYDVHVNEELKHQLMILESQMVHAEVRASEDMLRVLETVQAESERGRADRAVAVELLERIASAQGVLQSPRYISSELHRFKRDIEEAEREKERQDVQYMQQVMALLSQADAEMALETSRKRYLELRREVSRSRENFTVHEPYSHFKCRLTGKVMTEPVVISSGNTCEREAIEREFAKGELKDPITGQGLPNAVLMPNHALYCTINLWRQQNYVARILKARIKLETQMEAERLRALTDLSELCKESANDKNWIIFESLLPLIVEALKVRNNELKVLCFSVLMAVVKDNNHGQEKLAEAKGFRQIIRCLYNDSSPDVTRAAVGLLTELTKSEDMLEQLGQQRGAILTLVTVLVRGNNPELATDIEGILEQLSYDGNSYHKENIKAMVQANWCKSFANFLHQGPEESKLAMTNVLSELELDDNRREALIQQNVIDIFVGMLKSGNLRLEQAALQGLQKFSLLANSKKRIAEAGGVPLLLDLLKRPHQLEMRGRAAAILADLTTDHRASFLLYADETPIEADKLVEAMMGILTSSTSSIAENAMKVLLSLMEASDMDEVPGLIKANDHNLQTFLAFIKMAQPPLRYQAIQVVFAVCRKDLTAVSFVTDDNDCLKALLHGIKNEVFEGSVQAAAVGILSSVPLSNNNLNRLMSTENVLRALVKIVSGENLEGQANALGALVRFTDPSDIQTQQSLIELGLLSCLKQVLKSGTIAAKIFACTSLKNISRSTLRLSREPHKWSFHFSKRACKLHKGKCSLKYCIVEAGLVPDMVETLKDQNQEVALAALKALESLVVEESMIEHGVQILYNCKAIDQLFPLLQSDTCSEKCLDLLEVILRCPGMKDIYGQMVKRSLTALCASRVSSLQHKAFRLYRQLTEFVS
uniref:RING-type E3 ubiquitin transferase n=1 Tax=Araucaria cunninghamii TaxID=56994 RepID=A0A0D6QX27_ARACU